MLWERYRHIFQFILYFSSYGGLELVFNLHPSSTCCIDKQMQMTNVHWHSFFEDVDGQKCTLYLHIESWTWTVKLQSANCICKSINSHKKSKTALYFYSVICTL